MLYENGKYSETYRIGLSHIAPNYLLKPHALAGFFQESFSHYSALKKLAAFDLVKQNLKWVIAGVNIKHLSELPYWCEIVRTDIWISEVKKLRLYIDFEIFCGDRLVAQGDSCWFILNEKSRPQPIEQIASPFTVCPQRVFEQRVLPHPTAGIFQSKVEHQVTLSDLDFNHHVNNLSYISIALQTLPEEFMKAHTLLHYHVKYERECFLHDLLRCELYQESPCVFAHKLIRGGDNEEVCLLRTVWNPKEENLQKRVLNIRDELDFEELLKREL